MTTNGDVLIRDVNLADQIQELQLAGLIVCGTDNCQKESENYTDQDSTKGYN